ncbi:hypothetical protein [Kitasatospora sp. NPDC085464]|uniref:hypothetical protein n=1 Tax=Kitasatospora sp. NPDC085464 TaxID=3364063 RepID=UPI0037C6A91D
MGQLPFEVDVTAIGSRTPHDHYLIATVALLTVTAQVCDTLRAIHAGRPEA